MYWICDRCNKTGILLVGCGILRYSALECSGDARGTSWDAKETEYRPQSPSGALSGLLSTRAASRDHLHIREAAEENHRALQLFGRKILF